MRLRELLPDDHELREDNLEMSHRGLGRAGGDGDRPFPQHLQHGFGVDPAHPMALQELGDGAGADALGLGGRGRQAPQFPGPRPA